MRPRGGRMVAETYLEAQARLRRPQPTHQSLTPTLYTLYRYEGAGEGHEPHKGLNKWRRFTSVELPLEEATKLWGHADRDFSIRAVVDSWPSSGPMMPMLPEKSYPYSPAGVSPIVEAFEAELEGIY